MRDLQKLRILGTEDTLLHGGDDVLQDAWRCAALCGLCLMLVSCLAQPAQPEVTQPYALLVLPEAIRLVELDNQSLDAHGKIGKLRLTPGPHTLRFAYAGSSLQHVGQTNDPLLFQAQAGHQYVFEAKT